MSETQNDAVTVECMVPNGLKQSDIAPLNRLLVEFSPHAKPLDFKEWHHMLQGSTYLAVASAPNSALVGMATLVIIRIPTGVIGLIEDVIVTGKMRGKGIGRKLMEKLVEVAQFRGVKHIDLTSRRSRVEANRLYQKIGFEYRETTSYRLTL
jgi:ribosomal protein S18 acetylase RimI-like enzyme